MVHETSVCIVIELTKPLLWSRFGDNCPIERQIIDRLWHFLSLLLWCRHNLDSRCTLCPSQGWCNKVYSQVTKMRSDLVTIWWHWLTIKSRSSIGDVGIISSRKCSPVATGFWWCKNFLSRKINLVKSDFFLLLWKQPSAATLAKILWLIFLSCLRIN